MAQIKNFDQKRKLNNLFMLFLADLQNLYPNYIFKPSSRFHFHPPRTIYYETNLSSFKSFALQLLHELGHAVSNHRDYHYSIERLKIETEAWQAGNLNIIYLLIKILQNHISTPTVIGYTKNLLVKNAD